MLTGRASRWWRRPASRPAIGPPSPRAQVRRHAPARGPVNDGVVRRAARFRAVHQSVVCSSARAATARSSSAASDEPVVTRSRSQRAAEGHVGAPGRSRLDPLARIWRVPSMWTGTTGRPVRTASQAAPARWGWPQPSGLRPPSGKISRLQPSASRAGHPVGRVPADPLALDRHGVEQEGEGDRLDPGVEEVVGGAGHEDAVAPPLGDHRQEQGGVQVAGVVGGEDHRLVEVGDAVQAVPPGARPGRARPAGPPARTPAPGRTGPDSDGPTRVS